MPATRSGGDRPGAPARRPLRLGGIALVVAVCLTYANSLTNPFVLDDQATVVQNPEIQNPSALRGVLFPAPDSPIAGRPAASLTFAANYALHGLDVRGYHVVNIALHAACALLILLVLARTFALPGVQASLGSPPAVLAFGAALLWAVHPLNSEVVDYISQRTESLMGVFYLLTLYAAIRAADTRQDGSAVRLHIVAVIACAVGMASKESMATAPLMVALYDRTFLYGSWRAAFARRRRLYAGLAATWILLAGLVSTGARSAVAGLSSGVSPWTYLLNQAQVIPEYLRLSFWPDSLVAYYGWPLPLSAAQAAPGLALLAALGFFTLMATLRWPAVGFAGAWFFVTLAPASSLLPVATEVGAERRMYLPLIALVTGFVLLLDAAWRRASARLVPRLARASSSGWVPFAAVIAAAAAALAVTTVARNREYASPLALVQTVVDRRPSAVAYHMLAEQLVLAGRPEEAIAHLREAVARGNSRAHYLSGRLLFDRGRHPEAIRELESFLRTANLPYRLVPAWLEPPITEVVPARYTLGRAYGLQGEWPKAIEQANLILDAVPSHVGARGLLGDAFFAQQQWDAAAVHYRAYLERQAADTQALINYGITQVATGSLDAAVRAFARAAEIDPGNARARRLLALAREDLVRTTPAPR